MNGWGNWAGPNIKEKKIDPQTEIKIKLAKIEEIKRKRRDGEITNVIFK
jgi:U3 small nucleolar RNA-associated protein 14